MYYFKIVKEFENIKPQDIKIGNLFVYLLFLLGEFLPGEG